MLIKRSSHATRGHERGATIVLAALLMTSLMGMAAFVVDYGFARQATRNEQASSDAAALAAAQDLPKGNAPDSAKADTARNTARNYSASSLADAASGSGCPAGVTTCTFTVGPYTVTVTTPYALPGSSISSHNLVYVRACRDVPQLFAGVFGSGTLTVCRSSVARNVQVSAGVGLGIVALDASVECAVRVNGDNTVTITGGALVANSTNPNAICGSSSSPSGCGNFTINASVVAAAGGIPACFDDHTTAVLVENADPVPDPFAGLPDSPCSAPAATSCTGVPARPATAGVCNNATMQPGRFTSGCNLGGGNSATQMVPGVYWFQGTFNPRNHDLRCATCSAATGGVLMYFETGSLSHTGNGTLQLLPYQLSQPAGSTYAGISIYQARGNTTVMTVGGTASSGIGSIYARDARINLHGNVDRVIDGLIVGNTIDFQGNTTTQVTPPAGGPTTEPVDDLGLER